MRLSPFWQQIAASAASSDSSQLSAAEWCVIWVICGGCGLSSTFLTLSGVPALTKQQHCLHDIPTVKILSPQNHTIVFTNQFRGNYRLFWPSSLYQMSQPANKCSVQIHTYMHTTCTPYCYTTYYYCCDTDVVHWWGCIKIMWHNLL